MTDKYKSVEHIIRDLAGKMPTRNPTTSLREALAAVSKNKKDAAEKKNPKKKPDEDKDGVPDFHDKKPGKDDHPGVDKDDIKKPDDDKDGVPNWADKKKGKDEVKSEKKSDDDKDEKSDDDKSDDKPKDKDDKKKTPFKKKEIEDKDGDGEPDPAPTKVEFNPDLKKDVSEGMVKAVGKALGKALPVAGVAYGAYDTYSRVKEKDYVGAGMAAASTVASVIPGPGTAVATALDAANIARDYKAGKFSSNTANTTTKVAKNEEVMTDKKKTLQEAILDVHRAKNVQMEGAALDLFRAGKTMVGKYVGKGAEDAADSAPKVAKALQAKKAENEVAAKAAAAPPAPANSNVAPRAPANGNVGPNKPANNNTPAAKAPVPATPVRPAAPATPAAPAKPASATPKATPGKVAAAGATAAAAVAAGAATQSKTDSKTLPVAGDDGDKKKSDSKTPPVASGAKQSFKQAFAQARKEQGDSKGKFTYNGKEYQTNMQGKGTASKPAEKYLPSKTLADRGDKTNAPESKPAEAPKPEAKPAAASTTGSSSSSSTPAAAPASSNSSPAASGEAKTSKNIAKQIEPNAVDKAQPEKKKVTESLADKMAALLSSDNPFRTVKEAFKDTAKVKDPDMSAPKPANATELNKPMGKTGPMKDTAKVKDPDMLSPRPKNNTYAEDVEQIDEISKGKARAYDDASNSDYWDTANKADNSPVGRNGIKVDAKSDKRMIKREKGMNMAREKLGIPGYRKAKVMAKEEAEQIDEISAAKVSRYISKANISKATAKDEAEYERYYDNEHDAKISDRTAAKRQKGMNLGLKKLTGKAKVTASEEVEFSDAELAHFASIAEKNDE